ncbi:PREDICTED: shikimate O-hydroxycinnamoyltransferase [Theobroma cacao]|uniref:Shikimate O-hydroxycinnamoyltransferase n=1 Tax=Theobroma cacao TaxID=3641 RepID=A0AB32WUH5_THECC|nr:PREDICTED: shikimate O-hydroxycinnamoyltransferase [Theobroma cacao]
MEITVKGSSLVRPAKETPKESHKVSNLDMVMAPYYATQVYFYKPNGSSDFFKGQVLKEALSKTLVPFYPMAGRLGSDENGRSEIICNAEGVLWVEAETTCAVDDLGNFAPSLKLRQLVPTVDYSKDTFSHPLFIGPGNCFQMRWSLSWNTNSPQFCRWHNFPSPHQQLVRDSKRLAPNQQGATY